jgi:glycine/D-amino acid oxidase-like deaminating enzyme
MAAGTARVITDLVSGRKPAVDIAGLTIERYR